MSLAKGSQGKLSQCPEWETATGHFNRFCLNSHFIHFLGSVLDDEEIVENLTKSKMTSNEISKRIQETEKAEREIQATRKNYLPIATRGALLYFVVASLTQVEYMYQFSLEWFRQVFVFSTVSKTKEQKHDWKMDETSLEKVSEISLSVLSQQNLKSERDTLAEHTKNATDVLTRNVFRVSHPFTMSFSNTTSRTQVRVVVSLGGLCSSV